MTSPEPMTRDELVELAALDVFGLLDEYESALFTRSFHHAPAAVQDEILELQAKVAADPVLLPDVAPSTDLRERVLAAVSRSIEQEHSQLAPIASIGSRRGARRPTNGNGSARSGLRQLLFNGSGQFWRAAAFVLCGAVIVLAYFQTERQRYFDLMTEFMVLDRTQQQLETPEMLGPDFAYFASHPRKESRTLRAVGGDGCAGMLLYIDDADGVGNEPRDANAFLFALGLRKSSERYAVRVRHENGDVEQLGSLLSNGTVGALKLGRRSLDLLAGATIEIVDTAGAVVLTTA